MFTSESIFEELHEEAESFPTYKELLESVTKIWQKYVEVFPVEIGPKDLVELGVLCHWIQQDEDGTIRIVLPKGSDKASASRASRRNRINSSRNSKVSVQAEEGESWIRPALRPRTAGA